MDIKKTDKPEPSKKDADKVSSKQRAGSSSKQEASSGAKQGQKNSSRKKKGKKRSKKKIVLSIFLCLVGLFLIACIAVSAYVISLSYELPDITAEDLIPDQNSFVYDQQGTEIATLNAGENRVVVPLSEMPDYLIDMVIASEDARFYSHNGVDVRGVLRAVWVNVKASVGSGELTFSEGASTITMQLVRNVLNAYEKEMPRKIKEALLALEFEKNYEKEEILYYYMNEIYIGPEVYGMQAGAQYYFNKDVGDISMSEAAMLIALIRNPGYYSPIYNPERALNIRNTVLNLVAEYKPDLYGQSAIAAKSDELIIYQVEETESDYLYPWYVDYVIGAASDILEAQGYSGTYVYTGGLHIYTTMDVNVQSAIEEVYANDDNFPTSSTGDILESAMLIMEPTSGQIKGLVGGRRYTAKRGFNRATDLIRSPGSTIKPVVTYGPAIDLGYGSGTVIDDSPVSFGGWSPRNSTGDYAGRITMAQAIRESRNVCAVKMLQTIGEDTGVAYGMKMGLPLDPVNDRNLSLTLGGLTTGVAPIHMAGAFATFANNGYYIEPYAIKRITDSQGNILYAHDAEETYVMSPAAAYITTTMLQTAVTSGTGTSANISSWQVAGKTGTNGLPRPSEDPDYAGKSGTKDAWFVGYTTALSGAIWMGYDNKKDADGNLQYMTNFYGGMAPAQVFKKVMEKALQNYQNKNFERPAGVAASTVDTKVGGPPTALTPSDRIGTNLYVEGVGPLQPDTGVEWVSGNVCSVTGLLANSYCPSTVSGDGRARLRPLPGVTISPSSADYAISVTGEVCTLHTEENAGGGGEGIAGVNAYTLCTDPRHDGEEVLANVPSSRQTGGCPEEYWETRYFLSYNAPDDYCDLSDHQVSRSSGSSNNNNSNNNSSDSGSKLFTPTSLSVSSGQGISLTWTDNNESSSLIYCVERLTDGGSRTKFYTETKSYTDVDVEKGKTYSYRVYAYRESDGALSDWSEQKSIKY